MASQMATVRYVEKMKKTDFGGFYADDIEHELSSNLGKATLH